jgi:hypothetical protein
MSDVRNKIRKLLALANDGTNEHVSEVAFNKARELMEAHGITEVGDDLESIAAHEGDYFCSNMKQPWHSILLSHVGKLYGCKPLNGGGVNWGRHRYFGMTHQIEAAEETFLFVVDQIETMYKIALKAFDGGLTKSQRAELRASFKDAAASRVGLRIKKILDARTSESRALVIINTVDDQFKAHMEEHGIRRREIVARPGFGAGAGFNAGGLIRIQKEVKA